MAAKPLPSQDVLRQLFAYEPETGFLRWTGNLRIFPLRYKGKRAFICKTNKGYFRGGMVGRNVMAHRVVWKWHNGTEPTEIDHIDGNPSNNKIENLRAATRQDNVRNTCIRKNNTTGAQGVHFRRNRFEAGIRDGERVIYLGRFKTLNAAKEARAAAEAKFGYHPNHGRPANG